LTLRSLCSRIGTVALAAVAVACHRPEPLPAIAGNPPATCNELGPPEVLILSQPTNVESCLTAEHRRKGVDLAIRVTREGRAQSVDLAYFLCLGANGEPPSRVALSEDERACILKQATAWRFFAFDTCASQSAYVRVKGSDGPCGAAEEDR
jgi:hypothetical protein